MRNQLSLGALCLALAACSGPLAKSPPEAQEKADAGWLTMGEPAQQRGGVQVAAVRVVRLTEYLQVTGTVQPIDGRVSHLRSLARGRLVELRAKLGDRVRAGQALALIDNLEAGELTAALLSARAERQRLRVLLAAQRKQVERNRKLAEIGAVPQKDAEQSEAEHDALAESLGAQDSVVAGLEARLRRFGRSDAEPGAAPLTALRAPFDGIVTRAVAAPGEVVDASTELFTVADISRVWVQAEVYEQDLGRLQLGQTALIHVDTYPDETFTGKVAYISDALDAQTRTAKVRCETANAGVRLKLDMFATVRLPTTFNREALAVPVAALQQVDGKSVVFVRHGATRFEMRAIQTGKTVGEQVEVLSGLKEGEPVVVAGSFHLKSIVAGKDLGEE